MKILVIGGVEGGSSAVARLRRLSEENEIIMFERGEHISFSNCGLPYYIGGVIKSKGSILVQTIDSMKDRFNIDIRIKTEVQNIDIETKTVVVKNLITGEIYKESYDKILLSTGSKASIPEIKGVTSSRVFTLKNLTDMDKIITYINKNNVKKAIIVGGGPTGMELAENFSKLDMQITVVELELQVLNSMDVELAAKVHQNMKDNDIELLLGYKVMEVVDTKNSSIVKVTKINKKETVIDIDAEIIILATGVKPETTLAVSAGCDIHEKFGIEVNEYMETSRKDIYAIGDAIAVKNLMSGEEVNVPSSWPAHRQGRLVADIILDTPNKQPYKGTMGTSILKVFDYIVGSTGLNEKTLQKSGLKYGKDYLTASIDENSNAGYYPDSTPMTLKVIFTPEGKILGAQGIGQKGIDKRMDILTTAIKCGMNVVELQELELVYAPQFSSAKDPINILGYYAENILNKGVKIVRVDEIENLGTTEKHQILDVRTEDERGLGFIPNSINIDLEGLRDRIDELDKEITYIIYCKAGLRGYIAYKLLVNLGYKAVNLDGGYKLWEPTSHDQSNVGIFKDKVVNIEIENTSESKLLDKEVTFKNMKTVEVDACGLLCPGPILKTKKTIESMEVGDILKITSSELGFKKDIKVWAEKTGNKFISAEKVGANIVAQVQKLGVKTMGCPTGADGVKVVESTKNKQTIIVFSGDMDKVLASFIIANGAIAMGKEVTMFFTFWGLNALRKENFVNNKKSIIDKMFGMMMPKGPNKLKLSNMNMGGMGTLMMKKVMHDKNVETLPSLMNMFFENGGKIIACDMSVDVMGFSHDELIDEVEYGGVAAMLGESEDSYSTLFI